MTYGFDDDKHSLPLPKKSNPVGPTPKEIKQAVDKGAELGFISRSGETRRKPGPKRSERQGRLTIAGPERVIKHFQLYADKKGLSYWEALAALLHTKK